MQFDKGYISPYFATDPEAGEAVLEDACVLLVREKISALADLLPLLEKVLEAKKPLLIVAEDVEGEALSTLVVNAIRKTFKVVAVKSPFFGDRRKAFMQDLAIVTGARGGVRRGRAQARPRSGSRCWAAPGGSPSPRTTPPIVDGGGSAEAVADRAAQLRKDIETTDSDWDREKLQERLAKLAGGVAVIKVGAATEIEAKERKHRIEDAVHATKAAVAEGIIAGGGSALVHAAAKLADLQAELTGDEATGVAIVRRALTAPAFWIAANGGEEGAVVVNKIADLPIGQGYDAATERVRRHGQGRHHRPGQGDQVGGLQRGVDRRHGADHRVDRRPTSRRTSTTTRAGATATATDVHRPLTWSCLLRPRWPSWRPARDGSAQRRSIGRVLGVHDPRAHCNGA